VARKRSRAPLDEAPLRVEQLIGRPVRDTDGRVVGRLEEFRAEREGEHWVVTEFDIGPAALLERLAVRHFGVSWPGRPPGYRVRWDQLNLDDPESPALTCSAAELKALRRPTR
jgi:hypothetical protein